MTAACWETAGLDTASRPARRCPPARDARPLATPACRLRDRTRTYRRGSAPGPSPRFGLPCFGARIVWRLRDYGECPDAFARARIEGLYIPNRIGHLDAVRHLASNDDQLLVHNRG